MAISRVIALVMTVVLIASHLAMADDKIFGKPVSEINPTWCSASIFPGTPAKGTYSISGKAFIKTAYMSIAVGSYTTCDHKQGTFLLALGMLDPDTPSRVLLRTKILLEFDQHLKPSLLEYKNGSFLLFDCEHCKSATLYEIDHSRYPYKFIAIEHLDEKQITDATENTYFVDCKGVFAKSEMVISDEQDEQYELLHPAQSCFKVSQDEYLMLDENSGLFSWNTNTEEANYLISARHVSIEREITGENSRRFVLISHPISNYSEDMAYSILYLTSNSHSGPSYELRNLLVTPGLSRTTDEEKFCIHLSSDAPQSFSYLHDYKVLNDGTDKLEILFNIVEFNCKSLKRSSVTKSFKIGDESFKELESNPAANR